jgi:sulfate permease, SulP family
VTTTTRALPIAPWLRGYDRAWLAKDVVAGLAAGAVVIPQAMAYATIAGLPVHVGLYTCLVPMLVYALLGGSRTLSVSTTSTIAVLTGSTLIAAGVAADADDPARALATLTLIVGAFLVGARLLRLGGLIDNISEATLTGIKTGVGLTVAAGQLPHLLGFASDPHADNFFSEMRVVFDGLDDISWVTVAFSTVTLAVLIGLRRAAPGIPGPLVVVVGSIVAVQLFSLQDHGITLIDKVPSGLPTPVVPQWDGIRQLVPGAFAIALMVFLETAAVARSVRRRSEPPIDNNQELVASGVASVAGAFFRAMPAAGGFSQTAINQKAGARTQLSELVTVGLAVACALFLGGVLSKLPEATLACVVVIAVLGLIDLREFVRYWKFSRIEFWVAAITTACGLALGLVTAVLVGVLFTLLLVIVELDRLGVTELQPTAGDRDVVTAGAGTAPVPGLLVLRLDGPLYTANVRSANRKLVEAVDAHPGTRVVVIDATAAGFGTFTVVGEFVELDKELDDRGVEMWVAALPPRALALARTLTRWPELDEAGRVHPSSLAAIRAYRARAVTT